MAVKTINMIMAMSATNNDVQSELKKIAAAINQQGQVSVASLAAVYKKEDIDAVVRQNKYDVIVMYEKVGSDSIGGGSIKEWRKVNPRIKLIMIVPDDKKGGMKLSNLFHAEYYNTIYISDFKANMLIKLILNDRTREEALEYYGLEEEEPVMEVEGEEVKEEVVTTDKPTLEEPNPAGADKTEPPIAAVPPDGMSQQEVVSENIKEMPEKKPLDNEKYQEKREVDPLLNPPVMATEVENEDAATQSQERKTLVIPMDKTERENLARQQSEHYAEADRRMGGMYAEQSYYQKEDRMMVAEAEIGSEQRQPRMMSDEYEKERIMQHQKEDVMGETIRDPRRPIPEETRRMPQDGYRQHSNNFYHEGEREDYLDDEIKMQPASVRREKPYEPTFGGGRKELPAQFAEINVDPTVASYGGYVIKPISDSVLLIEVPEAHFLSDVHVQEGQLINLITSRL